MNTNEIIEGNKRIMSYMCLKHTRFGTDRSGVTRLYYYKAESRLFKQIESHISKLNKPA
jgi:hypothetical protein